VTSLSSVKMATKRARCCRGQRKRGVLRRLASSAHSDTRTASCNAGSRRHVVLSSIISSGTIRPTCQDSRGFLLPSFPPISLHERAVVATCQLLLWVFLRCSRPQSLVQLWYSIVDCCGLAVLCVVQGFPVHRVAVTGGAQRGSISAYAARSWLSLYRARHAIRQRSTYLQGVRRELLFELP
jgi:hypothetical protein